MVIDSIITSLQIINWPFSGPCISAYVIQQKYYLAVE